MFQIEAIICDRECPYGVNTCCYFCDKLQECIVNGDTYCFIQSEPQQLMCKNLILELKL